MNTVLEVEAGPLGPAHDVVVVPPDAGQSLATPIWEGETASITTSAAVNATSAAATTTTTLTGGSAGLMASKLLTRPKTSSSTHRHPSLQYMYGSKCSIQVLGERLSQSQPHPQPQPQLQLQERPKTSVVRIRDKERSGTSVRERLGFVAVQGKELPLPICTTRESRPPGAEKDILSITTKLRNRSAVGARSIASLIGPTSRDRSAALLKELSLSLSLTSSCARGRPTSPFKECLREKWRSLSKDGPPPTAAGKDRPLTPVKSPPCSEANGETSSIPSVDGSQCSGRRTPKTERSKAMSYFRDLRESWARSSTPSKDSEESTRRSSLSVKDSSARSSKQRGSAKRTRSSGNVLNVSVSGSESHKSPRKELSVAPMKDVVLASPRIITINRIPSASSKESRTRSRQRADSSATAIPSPKLTLSIHGAPPTPQGGEGVVSPSSCCSSKERLDESPSQGEAPCKVTSFDMAISPVTESVPGRPRTSSIASEATLAQPVSVQDDAVLTLCALGQSASLIKADTTKAASDRTKTTTLEHSTRITPRGKMKLLPEDNAEITQEETGRQIEEEADVVIRKSEEYVTRFPEEDGASLSQEENPGRPELGDEQRRIAEERLATIMRAATADPPSVHPPGDAADMLHEEQQQQQQQTEGGEQEFTSPRKANNQIDASGEVVAVGSAEAVENKALGLPLLSSSSSSDSSSSTPTVPFSSSDLLYGNGEGSGGRPHPGGHGHGGSDDVAVGDSGAWDHRSSDKQKLKELDLQGNKRPASRNSTSRKVPNFDKVSFDRDREELRPISNSLPPSKQSPLRANGIKNNLLRADQFLTQRSNGTTGRDEDLVAMGTLWNPSQLQTRGSSTTTSSGKSTSAPNSSGGYATSGTLPIRRPINLSTSTSTRQLLGHHTTAPSFGNPGMGNVVRSNKEVEPKYSDPLAGASPSFQQRLMELAALEAETVRWERTKKVKKKPKQDRDS